jgi:hypothetical protein
VLLCVKRDEEFQVERCAHERIRPYRGPGMRWNVPEPPVTVLQEQQTNGSNSSSVPDISLIHCDVVMFVYDFSRTMLCQSRLQK